MINKIASYGCSFIYGDGVEKHEAFPEQLGELLQVPVRNRGVNGSSNKLSLTYLIDDISKQDYSNTLVVFGWTGIQRTHVWNDMDNYWIPILPAWLPDDINQRELVKFYYGNMYTDFDAFLTFYQQQLLAQSLLKQYNIPYVFVNAFREEYIFYHDKNLQRIIDMIDKTKFLFGYEQSIRKVVCAEKNMICSDGWHPSTEGHKLVAEECLDFLKKIEILK
jgi:lysophospholipase L1-like esterase